MISLQGLEPIPMKHGTLHLSLELSAGKAVALGGANGIGKSTLINYFKINQASIFKDLLPSFLNQFPLAPLGELTTREMLEMLAEYYPEHIIDSDISHYPLINRFEFSSFMDRGINSLSGGQNQIAKLIACFYMNAQIYFLDEPSNNLDKLRLKVLNEVIQEKLRQNKYMLIIDHNLEFLKGNCTHFKEIVESSSGQYIVESYGN